jgi:LssY C-terminus
MPARNLCRGLDLVTALTVLLGIGVAAEARDLRGAWVTDKSTCKKVFTGEGTKLRIAEDADFYGSGFIYENNRLRGKIATCVIKTQKQDGDVLQLITLCSDDVTLGTVQFSLRIHDDNEITRFYPGVSELDTKYYRCSPLRFLPIVTDPNYFSAPEVERLLRGWWRGSTNASIASVVAQSPISDVIPEKRTAAGFVFTHREGGLKLFQVGFETDRKMLQFKFVLPVGGSSYAIEKVDFGSIYPPGTVEAVDLAALREKLAQLRCCTTNKAGNTNGDPLNIVVVGRGIDALFAFIERGWRLDEPFDLHSIYRTIRAFLFRSEYLNAPVSPLYVFGRQQDVALQKARDTVSQRNHLRLWLAPLTIDGLQVWVGQISRDIGIKMTTQSWHLTTHVISPDVDQDRFYLMQDLILSGAVSRFGFVRGVGISSMPDPRANLTGEPYLTDGLRLVLFLNEPPRALDQIDFLDWERVSP